METTKRSFDFTAEDEALIERILRFLTKSTGKPSKVAAIRYALRKGVKGLPR